jgi:dolichol kinase
MENNKKGKKNSTKKNKQKIILHPTQQKESTSKKITPQNSPLRLTRKTIHFLACSLGALSILLLGPLKAIVLFLIVLGAGLILSYLLVKKIRIKALDFLLWKAAHEHEKVPGHAGIVLCVVAIVLTAIFFSNPIIPVLALFSHGVADPIASIVGKKFGKIKLFEHSKVFFVNSFWKFNSNAKINPNSKTNLNNKTTLQKLSTKTFEGTATYFLFSLATTKIVFSFLQSTVGMFGLSSNVFAINPSALVLVSASGFILPALLSAIAETLPIEDNISCPIVFSAALWFLL